MSFEARQRLSRKLHTLLRGRSIREFARDVDLPYGTVQTWFAGEGLPRDVDTAKLVAGWLGMDLNQYAAFLDGDDEPTPREATLEEVMTLASTLSKDEKIKLIAAIASQLTEE